MVTFVNLANPLIFKGLLVCLCDFFAKNRMVDFDIVLKIMMFTEVLQLIAMLL